MFFLTIFIILGGLLVGTSLIDFIHDESHLARATALGLRAGYPCGGSVSDPEKKNVDMWIMEWNAEDPVCRLVAGFVPWLVYHQYIHVSTIDS